MEFKKYKRTQIAEIRPVTEEDILKYKNFGRISIGISDLNKLISISISDADLLNGSPKIGDMIARNPESHNDQWLVEEQYFKDNFEELELGKMELCIIEKLWIRKK